MQSWISSRADAELQCVLCAFFFLPHTQMALCSKLILILSEVPPHTHTHTKPFFFLLVRQAAVLASAVRALSTLHCPGLRQPPVRQRCQNLQRHTEGCSFGMQRLVKGGDSRAIWALGRFADKSARLIAHAPAAQKQDHTEISGFN